MKSLINIPMVPVPSGQTPSLSLPFFQKRRDGKREEEEEERQDYERK